MERVVERIKEVILKVAREYGIEIEKVILFGSRARGDYKEYSDWDILIITKNKLKSDLEDLFLVMLRRELVKIGIIPEIIVSSREEFEEYKKYYGFIHYHAAREGISI